MNPLHILKLFLGIAITYFCLAGLGAVLVACNTPTQCDTHAPVPQDKLEIRNIPANKFYGLSREYDPETQVMCYFGSGQLSCVALPDGIAAKFKQGINP